MHKAEFGILPNDHGTAWPMYPAPTAFALEYNNRVYFFHPHSFQDIFSDSETFRLHLFKEQNGK